MALIDPESPDCFTQPGYFDLLAELRATDPLHVYAPGCRVVTRYADVREVSRDPARFCSGRGVLMNDPVRSGATLPGSILHQDPPQHGEWRRVASRWFTPRAMARLHEQVETVVEGRLAGLAPGDEIDLVEAAAAPISVMVIAELLGFTDVDPVDFRRWSDACIGSPDDADPDDPAALDNLVAVGELLEYLGATVADRRADPRDDLLSTLVHAEVEGRPIEDHEVVLYAMSLLVAGNETTRHLISGSAHALAEHPDQRTALVAALGADPAATIGADVVEECLRWITPIQSFARTATADTELGGVAVAEGDWLVLLYASANRDEAAFGPTAGRFDVTRPANPAHVAFGFGEHLCLGASLARLELATFLTRFLRRFPAYELAGDGQMTRSTLVRGHVSLPLRLA